MSIILTIKVQPSSGRMEIISDAAGMLKIYLKSPPDKGKANHELIHFIARTLKIPATNVRIITGFASRHKKIAIDTQLTYDQLLKALGISNQMSIV